MGGQEPKCAVSPSFEILQGLLSNKNIRIPMKNKFRGPPLAPTKSQFWADKSQNGPFGQEGGVVGFYFFAWVLKSQKYEDSNEKKISGTPLSPLKKPILGGQKPKWAVLPRRGCRRILIFCMGS